MVKALASPIDGLTEKERAVVTLLASGMNCRNVAIEVGVTEKTIYNYRKKPHVQAAIIEAQKNLVDSADDRNVAELPDIIEELSLIVKSNTSSAQDKIAASRVLLSSAKEYQIRKALERKISDLEAMIAELIKAGANPNPYKQVTPDEDTQPDDDFDYENETDEWEVQPQLSPEAQALALQLGHTEA